MSHLPANSLFHSPIQQQILGLTQTHLISINQGEHKLSIHKELKAPYMKMATAAKKDGITIQIASGFRSFERQLMIFNNKFTGKTKIKDVNNQVVDISMLTQLEILHAILLYSALPGGSRHHWGCDIDIYAPNLLLPEQPLQLEPWEFEENGPMHKLTLWLNKYAGDFNFYRPYARYLGGVAVEPWHLSYRPIAENYQNNFSLEALSTCIEHSNIEAKEILLTDLDDIIKRYMSCNLGR